MTSMWVPANDIEQHMREALRAGNQEEYFRLLARTDLLLPFAEETTPSHNGTGSWATWATEDRTHVLVFTSPEAMRACLHAHAGPFRTVSFTALADAWPDSEWWLAVDPGTPIEGYLPAWFVRQVAAGDTRLPEEPVQPPQQPSSMYSHGDYPPPRAEAPSMPQFGQFESSPFQASPPADTGPRYGETGAPPAAGPGGLPRREPAAAPSPPPADPGGGFGGGLPQRDAFPPASGGYDAVPPQPESYPPAGNPGGGFGGGLPQREQYPPADNTGGLPQRDAFPTASGYDAVPPQQDSYPPAGNPGGGFGGGLPQREGFSQPADTFDAGAHYPPAEAPPSAFGATPDSYDSPMASAMPHRDADTGGYGQPGEATGSGWDAAPQPEPSVWDTPAAAEPPRSSSANLPVPMSTALPEWPSEDTVEDELAMSASTGDTKSYLSVLLRAWAYLPVAEDCPPSARPGDPEFRWHTDLIDGAYTITAFTSHHRLLGRYGDCHYITTTFGRLTAQWPGLEYSLYVNPSTEVGANIPGPQVTTLVTWARTQGLLQPALDMDALGTPKSPPPPPPAPVPEPTPEPPAAGAPETMQKVLPHQQVAMTLERGYDRVAGFVHHYGEVAGLNTPEQLYNALGLLRDGVDFSPTDDSVHVIRWIGHRSDLYRVAYGGNDSVSAGRNNGWIVEPPPFSGDGYAPSVEGRRIVEYKVDSVRLPHGAVMTRISADGRSDDIAVYDSDRREWIRADIEAAASSWDISPSGDFSQEQQHA